MTKKRLGNMKNTSRFRKIYGVIILVLIVGAMLLDRAGFFDKPKNIFYFFLTPVQGVAYSFGSSSGFVLKDLFSFHRLGKENEELRVANENLLSENALLQEIKLENNLLRKQLNVSLDKDHSLVIAHVVGMGTHENNQRISINKGTKDGVAVGDAVITANNILIGKIGAAYSDRSDVILINNPQSQIPVILQISRTQGIVRGEYGTGVVLDFVPIEEKMEKGEKLVTLALDNIPAGLLVGEVGEIGNQSGNLFKKGIVTPATTFKNFEQVFIIVR